MINENGGLTKKQIIWWLNEALNNLTPADVYARRSKMILTRREKIKQRTLQIRRINYLQI
jgi:hypothetical protein